MKALLLITSLFLTACSTTARFDKASNIALEGNLSHAVTKAYPFEITSFSRNTNPRKPLRIYIEGDGLAWLSRSQPSLDPTPKNPVALQLAQQDKSANVAYIARPCQYSKLIDKTRPCPMKYWTGHRFAPETIKAISQTISALKKPNQKLEFIGFSGGANVAALIAAHKHHKDVINIRTVAGNLDHSAHTAYHKVSAMPHSLNAANYASSLQSIPQIHFIGGKDKNVTPIVFNSYKSRFKKPACVKSQIVSDASHIKNWTQNWARLLTIIPTCH